MPKLPDPRDLPKLSPAWWGAVTGAAVAGAVLFPAQRLVAGALGGVAMLAVALAFGVPCCADCAGASAPSSPPRAPDAPAALTAPTVDSSPFATTGPSVDVGAIVRDAAAARGGCA